MQIRLTGVRALLLAIVLLGFGGWRSVTAYADLDEGAAQELSAWLKGEYARAQLRGITDVNTLTPAGVDSLLASQKVSFASIKARGKPEDMVVRAEVLVDGKPPTTGESVRYYRMSYSTITGWRMKRETFAFAYYLRLF